jgi:hypothetical protein
MSNSLHSRFLTLGLAVLVAAAFAACADDPDIEEPVVVDDPVVEEPMAAGGMAADVSVDGTISALEGGITSLAPSAAIDNINGWIARLEEAEFDGSDDIVDSLEELRDELSGGEIDGEYVAELLVELGEDTAAAAGGNAGLERLASLLTSAGEGLVAGNGM